MNEKIETLIETGVGCWMLAVVTIAMLTPCALIAALVFFGNEILKVIR